MKKITLSLFAIVGIFSLTSCWEFSRQQKKKDAKATGEAQLLEAESSKKVTIETAKANLESAELNAKADIVRAQGIAKANEIIGKSLEGNKAYLEWLWIDNIEKNPNAVFYIPTENKVPIFNNSFHAGDRALTKPE